MKEATFKTFQTKVNPQLEWWENTNWTNPS
jgi:hypothetical protein